LGKWQSAIVVLAAIVITASIVILAPLPSSSRPYRHPCGYRHPRAPTVILAEARIQWNRHGACGPGSSPPRGWHWRADDNGRGCGRPGRWL